MSRENVEIVRRVFEAAARRDSEAVLALYHPGVEWDPKRSPWADMTGGPDVRHGHEGIRSWYRDFHEAFADSEEICEQLIDAGDYVVSVATQRARGRASGMEVERRGTGGVWTVRDGKVVQVTWFATLAEALESVGLGDPVGSWRLVEWTSSSEEGEVTHPMGEDAEGRIIYTADGRMSAHLMRRERAGMGNDEYISYTGTWELRGDEVVHHVELATYPDWPGTELVRTVEWDNGDLVLTTPPRKGWVSRLRWRRAGAPSS